MGERILSWKRIYPYFLISSFFLLLGFFYRFHIPRFKQWALDQIRIYSHQNLPVDIKANNIQLNLLPIGISVQEIEIEPKNELASQLAPIYLKEIRADMSILLLLVGHLRLTEINLIEPKIMFLHKKNKNKKSESKKDEAKKLKIPFNEIIEIPVDTFKISNLQVLVRSEELLHSLKMSDANIELSKSRFGFIFQSDLPKIQFKKTGKDKSITELSLDIDSYIGENEIDIINLNIQRNRSFIRGQAQFTGDFESMDWKPKDASLQVDLDLPTLRDLILSYDPSLKLPRLKGNFQTLTKAKPKGKSIVVKSESKIQDIVINGYKIGSEIQINLDYENQKLKLNKVAVNEGPIQLEIQDTQFNLDKNYSFSTDILIKSFELKHLFANLKVDVPLLLYTKGRLPCKGQIQPELSIECDGVLDIDRFTLNDGRQRAFEIVAFRKGKIDGNVKITQNRIEPKAKISIGESYGTTEGWIQFDKGFYFAYESPEFYFESLDELAGLNMLGKAKLKGSTQGTSDYATIDMQLDTSDISVSNYKLGRFTANFTYKDKLIEISNMKSRLNQSVYSGDLKVFLGDNEIQGKFQFPKLYLEDAQEAIRENFPIPLTLKGEGSANIDFKGPLEFEKLSYVLKSNFQNANIEKENIEKIRLNIESKKGVIEFQNIEMQTLGSVITAKGTAQLPDQLELSVKANNLNIDNSNYFNQLFFNLDGLLDFQWELRNRDSGFISVLKTNLKNTYIGNQKQADSKVDMLIDPQKINANVNLFGGKIVSDFSIPFDLNKSYSLYLKTNSWDFSPLLEGIDQGIGSKQFSAVLNSEVLLSSKKGGFWQSNGSIHIDQFRLQKADNYLANQNSIQILFKDGFIDLSNFKLIGKDSFLNIEGEKKSTKKLDMKLNGNLNLSLFSFLTPFFSDFRGKTSVSTKIVKKATSIDIVGSALVNEASIKINNFPHTFENINMDLLFSNNKIIINQLNMGLAGGDVKGSGSLLIKENGELPLNVEATISNSNLEVVKGIKTKVNANITITGNQLPYTMKGSANVLEALIGLENSAAGSEIQASEFLPPSIKEEKF